MTTPRVEQERPSNVEVKMTRDVTVQAIAERTGGSLDTTTDGFTIVVAYSHLDEALEIYMERDPGEIGEHPSILNFPITTDDAAKGKMVLKTSLHGTVTILRPDSVSFILMQAPDLRLGSKAYPIEFLISPNGFSYRY